MLPSSHQGLERVIAVDITNLYKVPLTSGGRDTGLKQRNKFALELDNRGDGSSQNLDDDFAETERDPDLDKTSWGRFEMPTLRRFVVYSGPGLSTILGSTDAGCMILACAAGKQMGYALIPMQMILSLIQMVMLFYASRLGTATGMGFIECVQQFYGKRAAIGIAVLLIISCYAEMVQEFTGLAGVSEILKIHPAIGVLSGALVFLTTVLLGGSSIHKVVVVMGVTLAVFVPLMFYSNPNGDYMGKGWDRLDPSNHVFLMLAGAQAGGMVIPWMVFYQQSTVARERFEAKHLGSLHMDVVLGSLWQKHGDTDEPLRSVKEVSDAVEPYLGSAGKVLFCIGFSGAALVGGLCLSNTAAMLFNEVIFSSRVVGSPRIGGGGARRHPPTAQLSGMSSKVYTLFVLAAAAVVLSGLKAVHVTIIMALVNAIISAMIIAIQFSMGVRVLNDESICDAFWTLIVIIQNTMPPKSVLACSTKHHQAKPLRVAISSGIFILAAVSDFRIGKQI
eukprot:jgi/Bigna1/77785/fgenesh1_pg.50_\